MRCTLTSREKEKFTICLKLINFHLARLSNILLSSTITDFILLFYYLYLLHYYMLCLLPLLQIMFGPLLFIFAPLLQIMFWSFIIFICSTITCFVFLHYYRFCFAPSLSSFAPLLHRISST